MNVLCRWGRLSLLALGLTTIGAGAQGPASTITADGIIIAKAERTLTLMRAGKPLKVYSVALGAQPVGPKEQQGDNKTPEGHYTIIARNERSRFHKSLRISYPNAQDIQAARRKGVVPGSDIMIHGLPNGMGWVGAKHRLKDWTAGCIAVTNEEMDEIWNAVPLGTPVDLLP